MDYEKKFLIGDYVKGKRTFNGEVIEGKFNGFRLYNKLNPKSVVGVIDTDERCYDVSVDSIELVESEDKKWRNWLIGHLKGYINQTDNKYAEACKNAIAWLEKQGEQNPEIKDDVLSRFAFYQYDNDTIYLSSLFVGESDRKCGYGSKILKAVEEVAKTFGISKIRLKVERNTWMEEWYKKNGYEYLSSDGEYDWLEKRVEQKPIEQDTEIHDLWEYIKEFKDKFGRLPKDEDEPASCIDYVIKRQKPAEWSEEDEKLYISALWHIKNSCGNGGKDSGEFEVYNWLKFLKDRVQPKQEWSEEDEHCIELLLPIIDSSSLIPKNRKKCKEFLKSLKPNHWKPSEEQMEALKYVVDYFGELTNHFAEYDEVKSLYNDLKSL